MTDDPAAAGTDPHAAPVIPTAGAVFSRSNGPLEAGGKMNLKYE